MLERRELRLWLERVLLAIFRTVFFWVRDDQELGQWILLVHAGILIVVLTVYVILNTIWQSRAALCGLLFLACLIWAQHITTGVCLLSSLEKRLTGRPCGFVTPILVWFGIPVSSASLVGVTKLLSSIFVGLTLISVSRAFSVA